MRYQPSHIRICGGRAYLVGRIPQVGEKVRSLLDRLDIQTWGELRNFGRSRMAMRRAQKVAEELNGGWSDFEILNAFAQYSEPDFGRLPVPAYPVRTKVAEPQLTCRSCGGSFVGDGFTVVLHCENAEEADYEFCEPDASPVPCRAGVTEGEE